MDTLSTFLFRITIKIIAAIQLKFIELMSSQPRIPLYIIYCLLCLYICMDIYCVVVKHNFIFSSCA